MKETQQQVQSIQNILVGENVLVFSIVPGSSGEEEQLPGLPRPERCLCLSCEGAPPGL